MKAPSTTASDFDLCHVGAARNRAALVLFVLALPLATLLVARSAQAEITHKFDSSVALPGVTSPTSLAVEEPSGNLLVRDGNNLLKFGPTGSPVSFSALGTNKITIPCGSAGCNQVAVDNSGGGNQGIIYVSSNQSTTSTGDRQVLVYLPSGIQADSIRNWSTSERSHPFCGVATDDSGHVYVGHKQGYEGNKVPGSLGGTFDYIDKFRPGTWLPAANEQKLVWPIQATMLGLLPAGNGGSCRIGANSAGDLYYTFFSTFEAGGEKQPIRRSPHTGYGVPAGPPFVVVDAASPTTFSVDLATDDFYSNRETSIARFDSDNVLRETFGTGNLTQSFGVAVNGQNGTVYATNRSLKTLSIFQAFVTPDVVDPAATAGQTSATISAEIDPAGAGNVTDCTIEYGTTTSYDQPSVKCTPDASGAPFSDAEEINTNLTGLSKETTYHYRVTATNANGTTKGTDHTFTTHNVADVSTGDPSDVTQTGATLNGSFAGNGEPTTYYFEWGESESYGSQTPVEPAGEDTGTVSVSAPITGLSVYEPTSPTYHFRLVATNGSGTTFGQDREFHTAPPNRPTVTEVTVSSVAPSNAAVSGQVNPGGGLTSFAVEYGTDASYGSSTPESAPIGSDEVNHGVSATLDGLVPGTTYHYRISATNFGGTTHGADQTFTTPTAPRVDASSVSSITQTTARVSALVAGNGGATDVHFEYGPTGVYGASAAGSPVGTDFLSAETAVVLTGLTPGTTYHYRVSATSIFGTTNGPDQTFTTQAAAQRPSGEEKTRAAKCRRGFVKRKGKCVKKKKKKRKRVRSHS